MCTERARREAVKEAVTSGLYYQSCHVLGPRVDDEGVLEQAQASPLHPTPEPTLHSYPICFFLHELSGKLYRLGNS